VGSIDEFVDVLSNAQLLEEQLIQGEGDTPSLATRGGIEVCTDGDACQKKFGEKFPKFGMYVHEYDTIAEAQASNMYGSFHQAWGGQQIVIHLILLIFQYAPILKFRQITVTTKLGSSFAVTQKPPLMPY